MMGLFSNVKLILSAGAVVAAVIGGLYVRALSAEADAARLSAEHHKARVLAVEAAAEEMQRQFQAIEAVRKNIAIEKDASLKRLGASNDACLDMGLPAGVFGKMGG
jgi:hypothetical protein